MHKLTRISVSFCLKVLSHYDVFNNACLACWTRCHSPNFSPNLQG